MSAAAAAAAPAPLLPEVYAQLRLADPQDIPNIHRLIHQMAEFEHLTHLFTATESSLSSTLFPSSPPFLSLTLLILDLSPTPFPQHQPNPTNFRPIHRRIPLQSPVHDPDWSSFTSPRGGGISAGGFLLCFPNYSTFMARPGVYVEDIFVREKWRRLGLGRMMLAGVAREAARIGCGRVEWCVLDWNMNAISFYEEMGAEVLPQWRICRLAGDALRRYGEDDDDDDDQQGSSSRQ